MYKRQLLCWPGFGSSISFLSEREDGESFCDSVYFQDSSELLVALDTVYQTKQYFAGKAQKPAAVDAPRRRVVWLAQIFELLVSAMLHGFDREEYLLSIGMLTRQVWLWKIPVSMFFEGHSGANLFLIA